MSTGPMVLAHEVYAPHHEDTVVLLHSLALDRRVWRPLISPLAQTRAVVTLDLRGHGQSPNDEGFTIEQMADDVARTLSELGRDRAVAVGLSMGGSVAQAFAALHPERCIALGLIDTTAWYGPGAVDAWDQRAEKARREGMESLSGFQLTRWFSDAFRADNEDLCGELLTTFATNDLGSYMASCRALGVMDLRELITSITVPTVILVGENDPATPPSHAADMHERIRGSEMHVLPGTKHMTPLERPEKVLEYLRAILP